MNTNQKFLNGSIINLLADGVFPVTALATSVFLTRRLGPEGYGVFALAITLVMWSEVTINALYSRPTIKFVSEADDWRAVAARMMRGAFLLGLGFSVIYVLAANSVASLLDEPQLALALKMFAVEIILFGLVVVHTNILIGQGAFKQRALVSAGRWLARFVFIVVLVEMGFSVYGAIAGSIAAVAIQLSLCRLFVQPSFVGSSTQGQNTEIWRYSLWMLLFSLGFVMLRRLDLLMIKFLGGTTQDAGIYSAAQSVMLLAAVMASAVAPLLQALLGQLRKQQNDKEAQTLTNQVLRGLLLGLPFVGLVSGAANEIVSLLFGSHFAGAGPVMSLLIVAAFGSSMIQVVVSILVAFDRPQWPFYVAGSVLILSIGLYPVIVPRFGLVGAASVTTTCHFLAVAIFGIILRNTLKFHVPMQTLLRSGAVCVLGGLIAYQWSAPGLFVILKLAFLSLLAIASLYGLGEIKAHELKTALYSIGLGKKVSAVERV